MGGIGGKRGKEGRKERRKEGMRERMKGRTGEKKEGRKEEGGKREDTRTHGHTIPNDMPRCAVVAATGEGL